jgi:hypothetical protein
MAHQHPLISNILDQRPHLKPIYLKVHQHKHHILHTHQISNMVLRAHNTLIISRNLTAVHLQRHNMLIRAIKLPCTTSILHPMNLNNTVALFIRIRPDNMALHMLVHSINHQETPTPRKLEAMATIADHPHLIKLRHRSGTTRRPSHRPIVHLLISVNTQITRSMMEPTRGSIRELRVISQTRNRYNSKIMDMDLMAINKRRRPQLLIIAISTAWLKHLKALL